MLLNHSICVDEILDETRHGPATTESYGERHLQFDKVNSLHCNSFPLEATDWLKSHRNDKWPGQEFKIKSERRGCYVVPVSSNKDLRNEYEWRISTCLSERDMMLDINETQMRCYILMKILLKTNNIFNDVISSYVCKNTLFHCIQDTDAAFWTPAKLVSCLNRTLELLYNFVKERNCPHFIIPGNNLLLNKITTEKQQSSILETIQQIIERSRTVFLEVSMDDIGERIKEQ